MNATLAALARDKQLLLAQSSLCRLQLRGRSLDLRDSLHWGSAATVVTAVPALRRAAFDLVSSLVGRDRTAHIVSVAGRMVRLANLAGSLMAFARGDQPPRARGIALP